MTTLYKGFNISFVMPAHSTNMDAGRYFIHNEWEIPVGNPKGYASITSAKVAITKRIANGPDAMEQQAIAIAEQVAKDKAAEEVAKLNWTPLEDIQSKKLSACGQPVPNGILFAYLPVGAYFTSPDMPGVVYQKSCKTYGKRTGKVKVWDSFTQIPDEYVTPVKYEKPAISRNKREGKYSGKHATWIVCDDTDSWIPHKARHFRTGKRHQYGSLQEQADATKARARQVKFLHEQGLL